MYIAHHRYDAEKDDELTLEEGDVIQVSDQTDPGWWVGIKVKDDKAGWFPSNVRDGRLLSHSLNTNEPESNDLFPLPSCSL